MPTDENREKEEAVAKPFLPELPPLQEVLKKRSEELLHIMRWDGSLLNFFSGTKGDGLRVSFVQEAHSRMIYFHALTGPACIVEGNVIICKKVGPPFPMMGTKSGSFGNISFAHWLTVAARSMKKGILLHLTSDDVVKPAAILLRDFSIAGPVILRADILRAETNSPQPVAAHEFFSSCEQFIDAVLCVGWTADYGEMISRNAGYSPDCLGEMVEVLKFYKIEERNASILFSVHAMILKNCIPDVQKLLSCVPNSSLYVWSDENNLISDISVLQEIRNAFYIGRVFYSFPQRQISVLSN